MQPSFAYPPRPVYDEVKSVNPLVYLSNSRWHSRPTAHSWLDTASVTTTSKPNTKGPELRIRTDDIWKQNNELQKALEQYSGTLEDHSTRKYTKGNRVTNPFTIYRIVTRQILNECGLSGYENDHGDAQWSGPLLEPLQDLRRFVSRAYVPPMPDELLQEWVNMLKIKCEEAPERAWGRMRANVNPVVLKPSGGRRTLIKIEQINSVQLMKFCDTWSSAQIPQRVDLRSLRLTRPDLFSSTDTPKLSFAPGRLVPDSKRVGLNMKANGFKAYHHSSSMDNIIDTSTATLTESSTGEATRSPSYTQTASPSDDAASRLFSVLQTTLLETASSVLHVSEGRAMRGWRWMSRQEAWDHASARKVGTYWFTVNEVEHVQLAPTRAPFGELDWVVWGKPGAIDPVNGRDTGALGMLVVFLPPWTFPQQSLSDFAAAQEFSDGIRGEREFLPHEALLAAVYDLCRELRVLHFTIVTYTHVVSGAFTKCYSTAFVSEPVQATIPPAPSPSSTLLSIASNCKLNSLRLLAYWMRCGMRNSEYAWPIPFGTVGSESAAPADLEHDHEVFREALNRVRTLLEHPYVASALRQSESYGPLEESDFALVRSLQLAQTLDMEHRREVPTLSAATQAAPWANGNSIDDDTMCTAPPEEVVPPLSVWGPAFEGYVSESRGRPEKRIPSGSIDATTGRRDRRTATTSELLISGFTGQGKRS
ncbi:hypothetical protein FRB90_001163 [Tulasnella sp. 427]|nr:hypothetical protein FRB90_001163 [Tulasnella sp. 427]